MSEVFTETMALAEQSHRFGNMLQMVAGMLAREARTAECAAALVLEKAQAQIEAFAALNDLVRAQGAGGPVCLAAYLRRVCRHLEQACLTPRGVRLVLSAPGELPLPERACRHLGLAVTELVLNAVKHAFGGSDDGLILVGLESARDRVRVAVADNGCGMADGASLRTGGLGFVEQLVRSVRGACACESGPLGTRFLLNVPA